MRYFVILMIVGCSLLLGNESSDAEWDKHRFISRKILDLLFA
ncbi:hypothetical protein [Helicobacter trogontum]|uniref:Uncharacterized protein n=1 Tax=Helicobacter trogontum TaxID=50960 RepID=A0ABQ0D7E4_9HELI|nr:hypothetical protein [Helicobacter trogontum]MDY5185744.1 hypothetical protein [Helicobacter trogontum]